MKKNIYHDFRGKTTAEIQREINRLRLECKKKQLENHVNKLKNTCEIRSLKRDIARLYTLYTQKIHEKNT